MPFTEILAILMLVAFFVLLLAGIPVALTLATAGLVFGYIGFGPALFNLLPARIFGVVTNYTLIAMPLFVFMGMMLEKSKLAEELMEVIAHGRALGNLPRRTCIGILDRRRPPWAQPPASLVLRSCTRVVDDADPVAAWSERQGVGVRHYLRFRYARPNHSAEPYTHPACGHSQRTPLARCSLQR